MRKKFFTLLAVTCALTTLAQTPPLVYDTENTGEGCPTPALPPADQLPSVLRLPNPFEWSDGSGTITSFNDWACRRAEIKAEIEQYEIGKKPDRPTDITASYVNDTLYVTVNENGKTVELKSRVTLPATGNGPFPVIIGMNSPTGSLSRSLFEDCIQIPFNHNQVATYSMNGQKNLEAPFYQMYPELSEAGDYSAWSWGISRLIDGIELVKSEMNANPSRIAVTGCSYAGKMALFAGAFDERIALTIAQESGGGGVNSWRVSETIGSVEKISNTNYSWFMPALRDNFNGQADKLPYDHHELIAMIAPRAFLSLGNPDFTWLGDESGYVSCMAALEVWKYMGIEDRFGFDFSKGHNHCAATESQNEAVTNFVDKFLFGNADANTSILTHPFDNVNYKFWLVPWGAEDEEPEEPEQYWYEAETNDCATIGSDFITVEDAEASNGKYVTVKEGLNSTDAAPGEEGLITIPFKVMNNGKFYIYFRLNCATYDDDSFWIKVDDGSFESYNGLFTDGAWQWVSMLNAELLTGSHTLTIGYREDGAKLDKVYITNSLLEVPTGLGEEESECSLPDKVIIFDFESGNLDGWTKQNPGRGIDITQEDKYNGEYAMKMENGAGSSAWSIQAFTPPFEVMEGHDYKVSFWIRAVGGEGKGRISITGSGQLGSQYWPDFNVGDEWQQVTYENLTAGGTSVQLSFDMGYAANKIYYIDDIVIENTTLSPPPTGIYTPQEEIPGINLFCSAPGKLRVTVPENSSVKIIDLLGKTIEAGTIYNSPIEFSLSPGIYIVWVKNKNRIYTQKVMIN